MVGGGSRRDEGSFTVSSTNVFAALETLKKKKKPAKEKGSSKGSKSSSKAVGKSKDTEDKQMYWAPAPLTVKSWADVDDDDDYYATTAPPQPLWGGSGLSEAVDTQKPEPVEESESEDDLDEDDDDLEDEVDHETEVQEQTGPVVIKPVEASPAPKETDRQLSKKERRKKELAELEAILADFGVNPKEKSENEPSDVNKGNGDADQKDGAPAESKSSKKKKKKDKASKVSKEPQHQPNSSDAPIEQDENAGNNQADEDSSSGVDVKGRLKKMASSKKKKSSKEMDTAARAAALEAAARSAKLASAKKKEKSHYNQQPIR